MPYYVYVLYSESHNIYYKGFTEAVLKRLHEHNSNLGRYTANKGPWTLLIVEQFATKREALLRERSLKKSKASYFEWLRIQQSNIISEFVADN